MTAGHRFSWVAHVTLLALLVGARPVSAQLTAEVFFGTSFSASTNVTIVQQGYPDLKFTAGWETRPFKDAWYYAGRLGFWKKNKGWALELVHHKAYMTNMPPEVTQFQVTYGYNLLTLNRRWRSGKTTFGVGVGPVIGHPFATVRGQRLPNQSGFLGNVLGYGYYIGGAAVVGALGRQYNLGKFFHLTFEGQVSAAYASFPIANGHATVPNLAVHFLVGAGLDGP